MLLHFLFSLFFTSLQKLKRNEEKVYFQLNEHLKNIEQEFVGEV